MPGYDEDSLPPDLRTRVMGVRRDIYNRHFRDELGWDDQVDPDPGMDATAQRFLGQLAHRAGVAPGAWNSPQERREAMDRYADQRYGPLRTMNTVYRGHGVESYLMDPRTQDWWNQYGRDMDFLASTSSGDELGALERWDRNAAPLYRADWWDGNMQANDNTKQFLANLLKNRDSWVAGGLHYSDLIPNMLRWMGSGELPAEHHTGDVLADPLSDARQAANRSWNSLRAERHHSLHNVGNQSAIVDTGPGSTAREQKDRQQELTRALERAEMGNTQQRWQQTVGWSPSEGVAMLGDLPIGAIDQTTVLSWPVSAAFGGAGIGRAMAKDAMFDTGTSAGLLGGMSIATGGGPWMADLGDPDDATRKYWLGTGRPVQGKSEEQMRDTDEAQQFLGNLLPPVSGEVGKFVRHAAGGMPPGPKRPETGLPQPRQQAYNRTGAKQPF